MLSAPSLNPAAFALAGLGVWQWTFSTDGSSETFLTQGDFENLLGLSTFPDTPDDWLARLHAEDRDAVMDLLDKARSRQAACLQKQVRLRHTNGLWSWLDLRGQALADSSTNCWQALITLRDSDLNAEDLKKSEKVYRTLVETSPDGILLLGLDGSLQMANQQAHRLFGIDELADTTGIDLRALIPSSSVNNDLHELIERPEEFTGLIATRTLTMQSLDDKYFEGEIAFTTIVDASGAPSGIVLFARDITEKVAAAAELQHHQLHLEELVQARTSELETAHAVLTQILQGSPVPTFVLDADNVVTHWNQACEKIMGIPAREILNTRDQWRAFYPEPRPVLADLVMSGHPEAIENLYQGKVRRSRLIDNAFEAEDYFPRFKRWMFFTAAPLTDKAGNIIGAIETLQDITERKMAEEYLLEAKQLAESAARTKAEFLANMSHEIRTPMNAVIGLAHLLLSSELSIKQREQVSRIHGAGKMLLGLINDILDFSKIEAGRMTLESTTFNLDDTLDSVTTVVLNQAQNKGLELNYDVEPEVPLYLRGDPLRLSQILVNLIGNAIKFTEQGGISVTIKSQALEAQRVRLEVHIRDSGIGMTTAQQQRLFQAFSQADNSITRKFGGTGLGLTICKRLVELMGGSIWVTSEAGAGSTFSFTIDLGIGDEEPAATAHNLGQRVLIVDDNPLAGMVLQRMFARNGCTVVNVDSGEEALSMLKAGEHFDCVTLDFNMPGLAGPAVAEAIRALDGKQPYLALVTAKDTSAFEEQEFLKYFNEVLHKPVAAAQISRIAATMAGKTIAAPLREKPRELSGMHILLADDMPTNQLIGCEMLESFGATVSVANNGLEVLQALETRVPDLVLIDVQMPLMDGIEATRRIREDVRWQELPIVAMTAHAFDEERQRCLEAGMNDFLTKPIDPDVLHKALARWYRPKDANGSQPPLPSLPAEMPPGAAGWPILPGIDTTEGLRRMMNKPKLYEKVLRDFHLRFRDEVAVIRTALAANDRETAIRTAHSVKGLAGSIGAASLQAAALALEVSIREASADIETTLSVFAERLQEIMAGLAAAYPLETSTT